MKLKLIALSAALLASGAAFAQATDTVAKAKASGMVTMGVRDSSGALSYTLGDGKYVGYHVEICQRVIANLEKAVGKKLEVKYQPVTSQNRIPLVQNGTVDIECGSTTNNATRAKDVSFLVTTFVEEVRLVAHRRLEAAAPWKTASPSAHHRWRQLEDPPRHPHSPLPFSSRSCHSPPMRVLVVEDDAKIASFVVRGLKQAGYAVDHAPDGETGLALADSTDYDAAIVDVMLPKLDGISLVKRLRAARRPLAVLFLSAKSSVDDRVRGLQAGGDDYLTKPFAFSELLARVQALIRRATSSPETTRLVAGDVTLDLVTREVRCGGQPVELQPREFSLLAFLLRHAGRPVSKTMILEHVWDYSFDPQTNVVDVVMSRLRAKIDPDHKRIETARGVGYTFRPHGHA